MVLEGTQNVHSIIGLKGWKLPLIIEENNNHVEELKSTW